MMLPARLWPSTLLQRVVRPGSSGIADSLKFPCSVLWALPGRLLSRVAPVSATSLSCAQHHTDL